MRHPTIQGATSIRCVVLLLIAASPVSASAGVFTLSNIDLTAFSNFSTQLKAEKNATDANSAPPGNAGIVEAETLVRADADDRAIPFPNLPTGQTRAFASSAGDNFGAFGVGVSGFFFLNSLPPNALSAGGSLTQSITNDSTVTLQVVSDFFIPAPTIRLFGVGNSFPPGADLDRDAAATVEVRLLTKVTHPNGSIDENIALDYGMRLFREPVSGVLTALTLRDGDMGNLQRIDEFDGSFGFVLSQLQEVNFPLGNMGPGDTFEFSYDYLASASTGFGETGVFAAIGDPFDLSISGGRVAVQVTDPLASVPAPAAWTLLGAGLLAMRLSARATRITGAVQR